MEENSIQKVITNQLQLMVQHFFPTKLAPEEQQKYLGYFLRVLSGRIYATGIEDEQHVMALMRKRISKLHSKGSESSTKLARFHTLVEKLNNSSVITKKYIQC